jgi:predicted  nucleic acid-binding Zn-ribbon protein
MKTPSQAVRPMSVADLLSDIGAIDANLMSLAPEEMERIHFYVEERERLLRTIKARIEERPVEAEGTRQGLFLVKNRTKELQQKLSMNRAKILGSMQAADAELRRLDSIHQFLSAETEGKAPATNYRVSEAGQLISRIG